MVTTFHIKTNHSDQPADFVKTELLQSIVNDTLGRFTITTSLLKAGVFLFGKCTSYHAGWELVLTTNDGYGPRLNVCFHITLYENKNSHISKTMHIRFTVLTFKTT